MILHLHEHLPTDQASPCDGQAHCICGALPKAEKSTQKPLFPGNGKPLKKRPPHLSAARSKPTPGGGIQNSHKTSGGKTDPRAGLTAPRAQDSSPVGGPSAKGVAKAPGEGATGRGFRVPFAGGGCLTAFKALWGNLTKSADLGTNKVRTPFACGLQEPAQMWTKVVL